MIRVLTMIAVAGFLLSAVCLSVAISIAGPEIISQGAWSGIGRFDWNGHHHSFVHGESDGPQASRDLAWSGETLEIDVPADTHFTQAQGPAKLVIRGPKETVDHVVVEGGHIRFDTPTLDADDLRIELTAPKVTRFTLNGSGKLAIEGYAQDALEIHLNGDAEAMASGTARSVALHISGSGEADLSHLANEAAEINISGSGSAKVAPQTSARLDISGSGQVTLLSHPKHLESHVSGSGSVDQEDGEDQPDTPAPPARPGRKT